MKTRLAADIGHAEALRIYRWLVQQTLTAARTCPGEPRLVVCFDPPGAEERMRAWLGPGITYLPQVEGDLGARMLAAFEETALMGLARTVIIGSDCPMLTARHLREALDGLRRHDVVLGPSEDGGYTLIGASRVHPELFRDISWSSSSVLAETLLAVARRGLGHGLIETLRDLDDLEDLEAHRRAGRLA